MGVRIAFSAVLLYGALLGIAHAADKVVDLPTRTGVTQRFVLSAPPDAKAVVVLFVGGHGGLQLNEAGAPRWGRNNFLVRSAPLFAAQGFAVALVDAPSDRQSYPHLTDFRGSAEHATDVKAVIAWLRENTKLPVWLVGTSRGTQSVTAVATRLPATDGPDGIVLTATVLTDRRSKPVPDMDVHTLKIPVLVVHHEQDGCRYCLFSDVPRLMSKLSGTPRKDLVTFRGGENRGDPCEGLAYHGFNGLEKEVVDRIAAWVTSK